MQQNRLATKTTDNSNKRNRTAQRGSFLPWLLWLGAIVLLVLADQGTKTLAVSRLKGKTAVSLIPGVLELSYVENRGMAFGLLQNRRILFLGLCMVFLVILVYLFARIPKTGYYMPLIATGAVLGAGAAGNFIDRFVQGYVVDFIYFSLIDFPVFNLADIYVVCGGILLVLLIMFRYGEGDFGFKE